MEVKMCNPNGKTMEPPSGLDALERGNIREDGGIDTVVSESRPDPEVPITKHGRRSYSAKYKQKILQQTDLLEPGEVGALLRREGLYWSQLCTWRKQRQQALEPKQRGPREVPGEKALERRVAQLERENGDLETQVQRLHAVLDIQKKTLSLCEMLTLKRSNAS